MTTQSSQKSTRHMPPPIVLMGLGLLLLVGGYQGYQWWMTQSATPVQINSLPKSSDNRISTGADLLLPGMSSPTKQAGVTAFSQKRYPEAIAQFQSALQQQRNDPESLIYLNNAKAMTGEFLAISVSVPIGSNLNVAQEILRGVAQSQDEVNQAGGINGKKLMVVIANDDNNPDLAKQIATDLTKSSVVAVVGHNASNASLAAAPIYQAAGLVMVSPTSFANGLSGLGNSIFRTVPTVRFMADPLAEYVVKTARKPRIAICSDSQAPDNLSFRDEFVASLAAKGGQLVEISCDFAAPGFSPAVAMNQAIASKADGLLLTPHVDRIDRAIALAQANQGRLALFASPTLYTQQTVKNGQGAVNGVVLPIPWHSSASIGTFATQAQQYWGGTVNWRTATAYDATRAITAGLQQQPSRQGLAQVLHSEKFDAVGASGKITFLPTGDRVSAPILVQVQPGGAAGYDFSPLK